MICWSFGPRGIIPIHVLRDAVRGYLANHPGSRLCIKLLSFNDVEFLDELGEIVAAANDERGSYD